MEKEPRVSAVTVWVRPVVAAVIGFAMAGGMCFLNVSIPLGLPARGVVGTAVMLGSSASIWVAIALAVSTAFPQMSPLGRVAASVFLYLLGGSLFAAGALMGSIPSLEASVILTLTWPAWFIWFAYGLMGIYCFPFD